MTISKRQIICLIVGSAITVMLIMPVKIPFSVRGYGTIAPVSKWVLEKGPDGQLIASTYDYVTGVSGGFNVVEFERGETIQFALSPSVAAGGSVSAGDTIGTIRSTEAMERLTVLNGQLATAHATLAAASVGEKESLVREAQQRLTHARAAAAEHGRQLARLETLFEKGIVSEQEYEIARGEDVHAMEQELADRFGPLPSDAQNLMYQLRLKALARDAGVSTIGIENSRLALLSETDYADRDRIQFALRGRASVSRRGIWLPMERGWRNELVAALKDIARVVH